MNEANQGTASPPPPTLQELTLQRQLATEERRVAYWRTLHDKLLELNSIQEQQLHELRHELEHVRDARDMHHSNVQAMETHVKELRDALEVAKSKKASVFLNLASEIPRAFVGIVGPVVEGGIEHGTLTINIAGGKRRFDSNGRWIDPSFVAHDSDPAAGNE